MQPNLDFLCRVCAANTRGRNSIGECVNIFKTHGLREKIERFLYLPVLDHDALPKVLCITCLRQVDATASLSRVAKHTQKVFQDFLRCSVNPKPEMPITPSVGAESAAKCIPATVSGVRDLNRGSQLASAAAPCTLPSSPRAVAETTTAPSIRCVSNPSTRRTQLKMISSSHKRLQNMSLDARYAHKSIAQRALFTFLPQQENGNNTVPLLAAPLAAAVPRNGALVSSSPDDSVVPSVSKRSALPAAVTNFVHSPQQQQQQIMTTCDYRVNVVSTNAPAHNNSLVSAHFQEELLEQNPRSVNMDPINVQSTQSGQAKQLPVSLTIRVPISLTERMQQNSSSRNAHARLSPRSIRNQPSVDIDPEGTEQNNTSDVFQAPKELPPPFNFPAAKLRAQEREREQEMIRKRERKRASSRDQEQELERDHSRGWKRQKLRTKQRQREHDRKRGRQEEREKEYASPRTRDASDSPLSPTTDDGESSDNSPNTITPQLLQLKSSVGVPDDRPLGKVIRDVDLLKRILNALQWPVNRFTIEKQMQQLQNTKFGDIMCNAQILQDTHLTYLIDSYLNSMVTPADLATNTKTTISSKSNAPKVTVVEKDFIVATIAAAVVAATTTPDQLASSVTNTMSHNLPPESSAPASLPQQQEASARHLQPLAVPAIPKCSLQPPKQLCKVTATNVCQLNAQPAAPVITVRSNTMPLSATNSTPDVNNTNLHIHIDSALIAQYSRDYDDENRTKEALQALLNRQRKAWNRQIERAKQCHQSNSTVHVSQQDTGYTFDAAGGRSSGAVAHTPATQTPQPQTTISTTNVTRVLRCNTANELSSADHITRPLLQRRRTDIQATPMPTNDASISDASGKMTPPEPLKAMPVANAASTSRPTTIQPSGSTATTTVASISAEPSSSPLSSEVSTTTFITTTVCSAAAPPPLHNTAAIQVSSAMLNSSLTRSSNDSPLVATASKATCTSNESPSTADASVATSVSLLPGTCPEVNPERPPLTHGQQQLKSIDLQSVSSKADGTVDERGAKVDPVQPVRTTLKQQYKIALEQKRQYMLAKSAISQPVTRNKRPLPVAQNDALATSSITKKHPPITKALTNESGKLNAAANRGHHGKLTDNEGNNDLLTSVTGERRKGLTQRSNIANYLVNNNKDDDSEDEGHKVNISVTTTLLVSNLKNRDATVCISSTNVAGADLTGTPANPYSKGAIPKTIRRCQTRGVDSTETDEGKQRRQTTSRYRREPGQQVKPVRERVVNSARGRLLSPVTVSNLRDSDHDSDIGSARNNRAGVRSRYAARSLRNCNANDRHDGYDSESASNTVSRSRAPRVNKTLANYYKEPDGHQTTQWRSASARNARARR